LGPDPAKDQIELWDLVSGKRLALLAEARAERGGITLSPDGRLVAHQDLVRPKRIRLWDARTGGPLDDLTVAGTVALTSTLQFSPGSSLLAGQVGLTGVQVWDAETGGHVATLAGSHLSQVGASPHTNWIVPPLWSRDGRLLAAVGRTTVRGGASSVGVTSVQVWEIVGATPTYVLPAANRFNRFPGTSGGLDSAITDLSFSPDGKQLASNGAVWEVRTLDSRPCLRPSAHGSPGRFAIFCADGSLWAGDWVPKPGPEPRRPPNPVAANAGDLVLRRLTRPRRRVSLPFRREETLLADMHDGLAFSPDGKHVVLAHQGGKNELWNLITSEREAAWPVAPDREQPPGQPGHPQRGDTITFSPDGKYLLTWQGSGGVDIRDVATGSVIRHWDAGQLAQPEQPGGTEFRKLNWAIAPNEGAVFAPPGTTVFLKVHGRVCVGDVTTGKLIGYLPIEARQTGVLSIAVSPDGGVLATGERLVRLWDARTGRELARWDAHGSPVTALAFSPDGNLLVSGAADGSVKLWDLPLIRKGLAELDLDW
jgi:WD40 repeat protein